MGILTGIFVGLIVIYLIDSRVTQESNERAREAHSLAQETFRRTGVIPDRPNPPLFPQRPTPPARIPTPPLIPGNLNVSTSGPRIRDGPPVDVEGTAGMKKGSKLPQRRDGEVSETMPPPSYSQVVDEEFVIDAGRGESSHSGSGAHASR